MTATQPTRLPVDDADVVSRLRAYDPDADPRDVVYDAADEIERLRRELAAYEEAGR